MEFSALAMILIFIILMALHVPIAICIGMATMVAMLFTIESTAALTTLAQQMAGGVNSFALLAIPFFILAGQLMGQGGIAHRLIEMAKVLIGRLPGGLALVNVMSSMLFGSISGSAVAATSAIGGFMIPEMNKQGYKKEFNTAVTVASSTTGLLIPPSNILIIYSLASGGVSIGALFVAGYLPGVLIGLMIMVSCMAYAIWHKYPRAERYGVKASFFKVLDAVPSLLMIVLIIGGIVGGIFTATEASVLAVLYALFLSVVVYRQVAIRDLPAILIKTVETTAIVMFLIATSAAMSWMLSYEQIPQLLSEALLAMSENPLMVLLMINLILLLVGTFMDMTPAVLIFTPIFLPVAAEMGISPLHFGIMMILNLCIGLCTPPVGTVLFVGCGVGQTRIADLIKPLLPLYGAMLVALVLVTFFPAISEFLPRWFGLL
ncbi:TRAP transporter large permease subunit [Maricurvus nonylphenolicus]|uniref:TRAP transporter large permease n=1 Tax=Maricurvus nonylphenolicus TaxID=1008307 RepID=UPI0036F23CC1